MRTIRLLLGLLLLGSLSCLAESYKVLFVNDANLRFVKKINSGKRVEVGDMFNDASDIQWEKEKQLVKAINLTTMKQTQLVGRVWVKESGVNALLRERHLSTHDEQVDGRGLTLYEKLPRTFEEEYDLLDTIEIETHVDMSESSYFQVSYEYGDAKITKKLPYRGQVVFLDYSLFLIDGEQLEPRDVQLSIDYTDGNTGAVIFVKDGIALHLYPHKLE